MFVKLIEATADTKKFEKQLNDFISTHNIQDIKYSSTTVLPREHISFYSALIIYEE